MLVQTATGALFAVTVFDIFPEAKQGLSWFNFVIIVSCGFLLFLFISTRIFPVCPSCSVAHFEAELERKDKYTILFLTIALGIHCAFDGIALSAGGGLPRSTSYGLLIGIVLHKIPEGFALLLLLLGANMNKKNAFLLTAIVESLTFIGGIAGMYFFTASGTTLIPAVFAFIGGGFTYLVWNNWQLTAGHKHEGHFTDRNWLWVEGASFFVVSAFLGLIAKFS